METPLLKTQPCSKTNNVKGVVWNVSHCKTNRRGSQKILLEHDTFTFDSGRRRVNDSDHTQDKPSTFRSGKFKRVHLIRDKRKSSRVAPKVKFKYFQ